MSSSPGTSSIPSRVVRQDMDTDVGNLHGPTSAGSQLEEDQYRDRHNKSPPSNIQHERLWIRYRTEYRNRGTNEVVWEKDSLTPIQDGPDHNDSTKDPVFEVLTTYKARGDVTSAKRSSQADNDRSDDPPPRSFATGASYKLRIFSPAIRDALNSVVHYYPSQSLSGDVLEVDWPYPVLVHHYDQLVEFRNEVLSKEPSDVCVRQIHAGEDIQALLRYLDETVMNDVKAERSRVERGCYTFEHLWYSFKPGTTMLYRSMDNFHWQTCVIKEVLGGTFVDPPVPWLISGWSLAFDGLRLDRVHHSSEVLKFSGEHLLEKTTRLIPDAKNIKDEEATELIEYGKTYWDLVQSQCKYHSGGSRRFPYNKVCQPVIEIWNRQTSGNMTSSRPCLLSRENK